MKKSFSNGIFGLFLLLSTALFAQQPSEAEVKAELMRLMQSNPELLMEDPEALLEIARKNLGIKDPNAVDKIKDDGITNATHKKFVEKIVLANGPISAGTPVESTFKTNFASFSEGIYARAYLSQSFHNLFADKKARMGVTHLEYNVDYFINGKIVERGVESLSLEQGQTATTFDFIIAPKTADTKFTKNSSNAINAFVKTVKALPAGTHKIKMEITIGFDKTFMVIASNEFNLTQTTATRDAFVKTYYVAPPVHQPVTNSSSGSGSSSGSSSSSSNLCTPDQIIIDNQSTRSINVETYRSGGGSRSSSITQYGGKSSYSVSTGTLIKVDGKDFRKITSEDLGKTLIFK